jgi:hypothetical protein
MSEIPSIEQITNAHSKIQELFLDGFKEELKSHLEDNHTYMYGKNKSIWRATEILSIDKEIAIYVLMGSNRRQESWGKLEEKFNISPVRKILTPKMVELGREINKFNYYKISFTDRDKLDGNFKLRVDIEKLTKNDKKPEDNQGFVKVKSKSTLRTEKKEQNELEKLRKEVAILKSKISKTKD